MVVAMLTLNVALVAVNAVTFGSPPRGYGCHGSCHVNTQRCYGCRLMQQEEEWKMDVEATLAMKDARARMIQMEKEELIQEVGSTSGLASGSTSGLASSSVSGSASGSTSSSASGSTSGVLSDCCGVV